MKSIANGLLYFKERWDATCNDTENEIEEVIEDNSGIAKDMGANEVNGKGKGIVFEEQSLGNSLQCQ